MIIPEQVRDDYEKWNHRRKQRKHIDYVRM